MERLPDVGRIGLFAPFHWLAGGFGDFMKAFAPCFVYGALVTAISSWLWWSLIQSNLAFWALALSCGFVFVAPMLAMGLYEAGRALGRGEKPSLARMLFVREALRSDIFYLGLILLLIYLLWGRIAQIVYGMSTFHLHKTVDEFYKFAVASPEGHAMLISGTIIGGIMAFFTFSLVVVSTPMLLDRNANVFGAIFTSLRVVSQNFAPMVLWAALITMLLLISAASWFLGLIVVFPWLGLASWRAYRATVSVVSAPDARAQAAAV
jgi:uncharacterized membrane protein